VADVGGGGKDAEHFVDKVVPALNMYAHDHALTVGMFEGVVQHFGEGRMGQVVDVA
jgi:hypothetical protein